MKNESHAFVRRADARLFLSIVAAGLLSFTGVVIETAMNVTFPTLMREFSVGTSTVQWLTTGYLLVLATVIPTSSFLKHRFPLKKLFVAGNLLFLGGTLLDAVAGSFSLLLLGRLLQGAGTGIGLPLMFNLVLDQAPLDRIGTMMGAAMLVCALAPAVGPSLGGFIVAQFGWRMIFVALVPGLLFSLGAGIYAIRQSSPYGLRAFDFFGLGCLAVAFSCLLLCSYASSLPALPCLGLAVLGLLAVGIFLRQENRLLKVGKAPLLNLTVFRSASFDGAVLGLLLVQFLCLGIGFLLPNYAQLVLGADPFSAGCILLPGCLVGAALAPVSGRLYDRLGAAKPLLVGSLCILLSQAGYNLVLGSTGILGLTLVYVIFTVGQGLSAGNILTYAMGQLPEAIQADGNAVCNTLQQLAGAVGTAVAAALVAAGQQTGSDLAAGTSQGTAHAFLLLLVLALCQGASMVWALEKNKFRVKSKE